MIYLYIKTHNQTGLKYFGKTESKNPDSYPGSGIYWKRHLKSHGNDVNTIIVGKFEDKDECKKFAIKFSQENDIVKSSEWANLKIEELDGGWSHIDRDEINRITSKRMRENNIAQTPEVREKLSQKAIGNKKGSFIRTNEMLQKLSNAQKGKRHSEETKEKIRQKRSLQVFSPESIAKRSKANTGKKRNLVSCLFCHQTIPVNVFGKEYHKIGKCYEKK